VLISLIYEPRREALPDVFKSVVLPMIKIRGKDQSWVQTFPLGIEKLTEVFEQRIDIDKVFSHANLVEKLVLNSGGSLRELMRLIQEACLETMGDRIDEAAAEKAIVNVRADWTVPCRKPILPNWLRSIRANKLTTLWISAVFSSIVMRWSIMEIVGWMSTPHL
jgi:hypothetical protein